jgi:hypothetical protein
LGGLRALSIIGSSFPSNIAHKNCKLKFTTRFVNKASDWTIRKREAPIQLLRLFDWPRLASVLLIVQSEALFTILVLNISLAICLHRLQIAQSNFPVKIPILWAMLLRKKNYTGLTVTQLDQSD